MQEINAFAQNVLEVHNLHLTDNLKCFCQEKPNHFQSINQPTNKHFDFYSTIFFLNLLKKDSLSFQFETKESLYIFFLNLFFGPFSLVD